MPKMKPWDTVYTSDASGSASVLIEMDEFSLYKSYPVAYRTVVAHLTAGTKAGCGIIGSNTKSVATLAAYVSFPLLEKTCVVVAPSTFNPDCPVRSWLQPFNTTVENSLPSLSINQKPGTSETVVGTVVVEETTDGIWVYGTWGNGEVSLTDKGVHIHEGGSCDNAGE